ncbi:hypothetical protein [Marinithermus hydrothermalis]|uniref:Uncharacterized protein n=1 Tax=Marinithermus hydrothermalis (strain DSM 14884 / JCM 11576 / T1) TaxID=869210 RepID=F2NK75_MARHT|nr:hypothetical protein [Marinithermus hydrothermalis]AEB12046.1 hypothetical protein Marky_1309 [Marinithermus hydrothermalis DSM 14884]
MKPIVVLTEGESQYYAPLLGALTQHDAPYHVHLAAPGEGLAAALAGLKPLGYAGAVLEGARLEREATRLVARLEPEAREAGRVDLVVPEWAGLRGAYLKPQALARLLEAHGFVGARVLWVGAVRPELRLALRGVRLVHAVVENFPEGEALLAALPGPQRGRVAVDETRGAALAREADVVIYGGGRFPLAVLEPYHTFIALEPPPRDAYALVANSFAPAAWRQVHLSLLVEHLTGYALPPEAFHLE